MSESKQRMSSRKTGKSEKPSKKVTIVTTEASKNSPTEPALISTKDTVIATAELATLSSCVAEIQNGSEVYPAFIKLKLQLDILMANSDSLCLHLITAFKEAIEAFSIPKDKVFLRELESCIIKPSLSFLSEGNPLPVALGNLVKLLKQKIALLPESLTEEKARSEILDFLLSFAEEKINLACEAIAVNAVEKLGLASVILTYSWSPLVERILLQGRKKQLTFRVVLVDESYDVLNVWLYAYMQGAFLAPQSRVIEMAQARKMLECLREANVDCSICTLAGIHLLMDEVSLVLFGAEALLANGNVLARQGCSVIALAANRRNIPVVIACPTYKFCEKVVTGTVDPLLKGPGHLITEILPSDVVSGVVTELRIQSPAAAPILMRVRQ